MMRFTPDAKWSASPRGALVSVSALFCAGAILVIYAESWSTKNKKMWVIFKIKHFKLNFALNKISSWGGPSVARHVVQFWQLFLKFLCFRHIGRIWVQLTRQMEIGRILSNAIWSNKNFPILWHPKSTELKALLKCFFRKKKYGSCQSHTLICWTLKPCFMWWSLACFSFYNFPIKKRELFVG